jgi:ribosomal protein S7
LTAQGSPRAIFQRAIERGNLLVAETTAREMGTMSLMEALELTSLIALKDSRRRSRVAARWLLRFLEEHNRATIEEAMLAGAALTAPGTAGDDTAIMVLTDMSKRATRDQRRSRVAS